MLNTKKTILEESKAQVKQEMMKLVYFGNAIDKCIKDMKLAEPPTDKKT
jgi:hypothetical protein